MNRFSDLLEEPVQTQTPSNRFSDLLEPQEETPKPTLPTGRPLSRNELANFGVTDKTNLQQRQVITNVLNRKTADPDDVTVTPTPEKQSLKEEFISAEARGLGMVGSAATKLASGIIGMPRQPGAWAPPETPEEIQKRLKLAGKLDDKSQFLWELSKHPSIAAQRKDLAGKAVNLIGETIPYITGTTAAYLAAGPLGGFAVGSMVEGNSAYKTALDNKVPEKKAQLIGAGVGLISGAIEAFGGKFAEKWMSDTVKKIAEKTLKDKAVKRGLQFGIGTVIEALEEGSQELAQITGESTYRDIDWKEGVNRTLGSMAGGAFLGGVMTGGSTALRTGMNIAESQAAAEEGAVLPPQPTEEAAVIPETKPPEAPTIEAGKEGGQPPTEVKQPEIGQVAPQIKLEAKGVETIPAQPVQEKPKIGTIAAKETALNKPVATEPQAAANKTVPASPTAEAAAVIPQKQGAEPSGGVSWQNAMKNVLSLNEEDRPNIITQQKKTRSEKFGAMAGTAEYLHEEKGLSAKEAMHRSESKLAGPQANYENRYQPLQDVMPQWTIDNAFQDIYDQTKSRKLELGDRLRLTNSEGTGAFDKMLRGTSLTPGDVKMIEKWQPILAEEAKKRVPFSTKFWHGVEQVLGTLKLGAAFDVQTRRQMRWFRGRHPVIYAKAVGRDVAAYVSKKYADKMAKETTQSPYHKEGVKYSAKDYGLVFLEREGEGKPEQYLTELPTTSELIKKTLGKKAEKVFEATGGNVAKAYNASMRGFIDSFNWMQQKLWDIQIDNWKAKNIKITPKMLHDLANFQNTFAGMSKAKSSYGRSLSRVLRPVMWSPTLTWSRVKSPAQILTNPTMRGEAAATLALHIGTGIGFMMLAAAGKRLLDPEDKKNIEVTWSPNSTDFGKLKVGNTRYDLFGDIGPYIRAFAQTVMASKTNAAGRTYKLEGLDRFEPLKQLARGKRAPAIDFLNKIWTGRNYYGGDAWALPDYESMRKEGGLKEKFADWHEKQTSSKAGEVAFHIEKEVYDRFMPFFIQSAVEAAWNDGWPQALTTGGEEFFSGGSLSYKPTAYNELQSMQDVAATQMYNKLWDDLNPAQQKTIENETPEMAEMQAKIDSERLPPTEISLESTNRSAKRISGMVSEENIKLLNNAGVRISGVQRTISGFHLNDKRYEALEKYTAESIDEYLSSINNTSGFTIEEINMITKKYIDNARELARNKVLIDIYEDKL